MVLTGQKIYAYWGWAFTGGFRSGNPISARSSDNNPTAGSDEHIPFNPITDVPVPQVKTVYEMMSTAQILYPNIQWTTKKEGEEVEITTYYRDPFLWCAFFPDTTVSATWLVGGSDGNQIIGTFGDRSEESYLWMQLHIHDKDGTNHHDLFFDGGQIVKYRVEFEAGKPVKEKITILFATVEETVKAVDMIPNIDDAAFNRSGIDGGWSLWDGNFDSRKVLHSSDLTITWGGSAISDIAIVSGFMEFTRKHTQLQLATSLVPEITFEEPNESPFIFEVTGYVNDDENLAEALLEIASKTTGTAKLLYNTSSYWQFTNGVIKDYTLGNVKGSAVELTIQIEGSANSVPSAAWIGTEATDPSILIKHVSP